MITPVDFPLTRDRTEALAVTQYLNPLPRSVVRRGEYELLDGIWRFELDLADRGLHEQWYLGHNFTSTAHWPGSIESQMSAFQQPLRDSLPWQDTVVAWYERDFSMPDQWCADASCPVQITFGACGYETRVWLNGRPLSTIEGEMIHVGEYTSFSYELPVEYLMPQNRLTVRIADSLDTEIPRGKQESRVYKRGGIWYQTISGPVRSIWLEPIERNRLRSRVGVLSQIEERIVELTLTTRVRDPGIYTLRLVIAPRGSNTPLSVTEYTLPLEIGEKRQRVAVKLPGAELWSPKEPNLYSLVAQLSNTTGEVSQIEAHFGLRKVETRDQAVYLNGQPLYLDGILYQPGTASFEEMARHMQAIKALGCNLVRVHLAGIDPRIYDLADEMGMLLWVEVPSPHSSTSRSRANHWAELMRMLVVTSAHPAVIIWSLYNEDWGADDIATNSETQRYIADTYNWMRLHAPHVLVVDNDGWHHISVEGRLKTDLLTAHVYTPDSDHWRTLLDRLVSGESADITAEPLVVGDPFFYRGQVPLLISEWGGFGFPMYGGPNDYAARTKRIRAFKRELRARQIAGDIYTQAVSIEQEINGLIDPEGGVLLVPPGILHSGRQRRKKKGG